MTTSQPESDPRGNASALMTPGVPWWAAVLIAVVFTTVGFAVDLGRGNSIGVIAWVLTIAGLVLAALAVRRHAVFTAMVQPPLVVVFGLALGYLAATIAGSVNGSVLNLGLRLISTFPLMVTATAAGLLVGLFRIVAQPLRRRAVQRSASRV